MENINLKINGLDVSAPAGSTILEAAHLAGIRIPTLCYLKEINEIGACRMCVVEVKGARNLVAACVHPVNEVKLTPLDEAIETQVSNAIANAAVSQLSGGSKGGMTAEGVRKVLGAAGLDEDTLAQYGITVEDIVNGNISKSELAKYGISGSVLDGLLSGQQESVAEAVGEAEIPREMQMEAIRNADLPDVFKDLLLVNNNSEIYKQLGVKTFAQYVGSFMAKLFIDIVSFLSTFLLVTIIIRAIVFVLDIVA